MVIAATPGACVIEVRVIPRSSRSEIVGMQGSALKVRLTSPPVDGAANEELIRLIAKTLRVSKRDVEIVSGETSKNKRLRISNLDRSELEKVIK